MAKTTFDANAVADACALASAAAITAATEYYEKYGDSSSCGFAWVTVRNVRINSKMGKALVAVGFDKAYDGGLQLWNPSKLRVQSVNILEAGARAYAKVLEEQLGLDDVYAGSRVD